MPQPQFASGAEFRAWLQGVEDRLTRLEGKRTAVVGGWVLTEGPGGDLIARHVESGAVVVLGVPPVEPTG